MLVLKRKSLIQKFLTIKNLGKRFQTRIEERISFFQSSIYFSKLNGINRLRNIKNYISINKIYILQDKKKKISRKIVRRENRCEEVSLLAQYTRCS